MDDGHITLDDLTASFPLETADCPTFIVKATKRVYQNGSSCRLGRISSTAR